MFMRKAIAAMATAGLLAFAGAAHAEMVTLGFSIENNSDQTITNIYYGPSSSQNWSDDILSGVIAPGETVNITVTDNLPDCDYDFSYTFDDGQEYTEYHVNMCEIDGTVHQFTN
ncbi:hypothetical protein ASG17_02700 [Brevundimonas sp. Leaf363]|uniref:hypothetical protein n=1 Tax=Brevundimonas sp. Leaf363 TaxID=1736353 RepID=UPI000701E8FF|nr:hypothetical protein [Brevundimonas sp. Leaf363]KQS57635.1 hypothetical protein ASG17_02700 [Brevundimonas sp. Leaf363]